MDQTAVATVENSDPGETLPPEELEKKSVLKRRIKMAVNAWLCVHLFAIVITPATVGPTSRTLAAGWEVISPYLECVYLNHGFSYFAPQPGSSTLIRYSVVREDGTTVDGTFPDRETAPRLLYHRYFMLSECLGREQDEWRDMLAKSFARALMHKHSGVQVSLFSVEHFIPSMQAIHEGLELSEPEFFEETPLGLYEWAEQ